MFRTLHKYYKWLLWNTLVFEANDPIDFTSENLDCPNPVKNWDICKRKEPKGSYVITKSWCLLLDLILCC